VARDPISPVAVSRLVAVVRVEAMTLLALSRSMARQTVNERVSDRFFRIVGFAIFSTGSHAPVPNQTETLRDAETSHHLRAVSTACVRRTALCRMCMRFASPHQSASNSTHTPHRSSARLGPNCIPQRRGV